MADYRNTVKIGWGSNLWIIKFNIETIGNVISFQGEVETPDPIIFSCRVVKGIMHHFSPDNINPITKELIIDVVMSAYEKSKLPPNDGN